LASSLVERRQNERLHTISGRRQDYRVKHMKEIIRIMSAAGIAAEYI
jgi:hypothetical protein